jgi:hypothetical protein
MITKIVVNFFIDVSIITQKLEKQKLSTTGLLIKTIITEKLENQNFE